MRKYKECLWTNPFKSVILSSAIGLAVIVVSILVFSLFVFFFMDNSDSLDGFVKVALSLGAFSSGIVCGRYRRRHGFAIGVCCGLVIITFIFIVGSFVLEVSCVSIKKLLISAVCSGIGGVCGVNTKRPKRLK